MPKRSNYDRDGKGKFAAGPTTGENLGLRLPLPVDAAARLAVCKSSQTPAEQRAALRAWLTRLACQALEIDPNEAMEPQDNEPASASKPRRRTTRLDSKPGGDGSGKGRANQKPKRDRAAE